MCRETFNLLPVSCERGQTEERVCGGSEPTDRDKYGTTDAERRTWLGASNWEESAEEVKRECAGETMWSRKQNEGEVSKRDNIEKEFRKEYTQVAQSMRGEQ